MHNAVMAEFGDLHADDSNISQETGVTVDLDMPAEAMGDGIELGEISLPQTAEITLEA
jgi:hypothetical protein